MDKAIKEGGAPASPNWRDGLEPRIRQHVAYCQDYVTNHNHGAPGHLDRVTVDTLAKYLDQWQRINGLAHGRNVDLIASLIDERDKALAEVAELRQQIAALSQKTGGYQL